VATLSNRANSIKALKEAGADLAALKNDDGNGNAIRALKEAGADVTVKNYVGETPLQTAASYHEQFLWFKY
jgi:ankyrin repeat protein